MDNFKEVTKRLLYEISKPMLKKVTNLKSCHQGEAGYVFGEGISLKSMDLACFSDRVSITNNYLIFHRDFDLLNCRYACMAAPFYFNPIFGYPLKKRLHLNIMAKLYKQSSLQRPHLNYFSSATNACFRSGENVYPLFGKIPDPCLDSKFITNRIACFTGAFRWSISLAIYLGFHQISLIGCDYTHSNPFSRHWYERGHGRQKKESGYELKFLEVVKEFIDISTITLDGDSDLMPSMTYKEYTGKDPKFRENRELADDKYLRALDTYPGNKIYSG